MKAGYLLLTGMLAIAASCNRTQEKPQNEEPPGYEAGGSGPATAAAANRELKTTFKATRAEEDVDADGQTFTAFHDVTLGSTSVAQPAGTSKAAVPPVETGKKIIRTADIRMEVKNLEASTEAIEKLLMHYGAYIGSSNYSTTHESRENQIVIRVDSRYFDQLLKEAGKQALFLNYRNINTQDVTMEFIDTEARLKNKKEVEQRYLSILRTQAKTVRDVLAAEEQLRVIREEIEAKEGQLRYLQNQVSLSTINLAIYEKTEYQKPPEETKHSFFSKLGEALERGWRVITAITLALVSIWPLLLAGAIGWYLWRRAQKKKA